LKKLLIASLNEVPTGEIWFLNTRKLCITKVTNMEEDMKRVMIESPFAGKDRQEEEKNEAYLEACIFDSLKRDEAPFASHGFYTKYLKDSDPTERAHGMACGEAWLLVADIVAFYVDLGMSP